MANRVFSYYQDKAKNKIKIESLDFFGAFISVTVFDTLASFHLVDGLIVGLAISKAKWSKGEFVVSYSRYLS